MGLNTFTTKIAHEKIRIPAKNAQFQKHKFEY